MTGQDRLRYLCGLMLKALAAFLSGTMSLNQLVSDVESLIDSLADVADAEWVDELRSAWWHLEFVNSLMLDEGRTDLIGEDREEVREAVESLRLMATELPVAPNVIDDAARVKRSGSGDWSCL